MIADRIQRDASAAPADLVSAHFEPDPPAGQQQHLTLTFSQGVSGLSSSDISIEFQGTDWPVPVDFDFAFNDTSGVDTATLTFPYSNHAYGPILQDGNYQLRIGADAFAIGGLSYAQALTYEFFFVNADATRDRVVNARDMYVLAQNWQQPGSFSQGDFNYDGAVNQTDLDILSLQWQSSIETPFVFNVWSDTSDAIRLSWDEAAVANEILWQIERSTNGIDFALRDTVAGGIGEYTDTPIPANTAYWYRVRAKLSDPPPPESPLFTSYSAKKWARTLNGLILTASPRSSEQIDLNWTPVSGADQYLLEVSVDGVNFNQSTFLAADAAFASVDGLDRSMTVYHRVTAYTGATPLLQSNTASATTLERIPETPGSLQILSRDAQGVRLGWVDGDVNETAFDLWRSTDPSFPPAQVATFSAAANAESYVDVSVEASTTYYYQIRAVNSAGNSEFSNIVTSTPDSFTALGEEEGEPLSTPVELLVAWYGINLRSLFGGSNPIAIGDAWFEGVTEALGRTIRQGNPNSAQGRPWGYNRGRDAILALLQRLDGIDGTTPNRRISASEVASAKIDLAGYSWGSITAVNESRRLNNLGQSIYGYKLDAVVPIATLNVVDPIHDGPARVVRWVWFSGVLDNVRQFNNWYQRRGSAGIIHTIIGNQQPEGVQVGNWFSRLLKGTTLPCTLPGSRNNQVNVTSMWPLMRVDRRYTTQQGQQFPAWGQGNETNHDTIPWYVALHLAAAIDPSFPTSDTNPPEYPSTDPYPDL